MKGARVQTDMEYTSSSCVWKNQIAYILCVSRRVHWYALPPCTLWKALASDTNPVPPLAEFCVPCVPSGTGGPPTVSRPTKPPKAPVLPPGGPVWRFPPRVGERPAPARSGAGLGHTGPSLAERKENSPTRKTTASVTGEYASFRLSHQANGFPKTRSGERCEKRAGERPGVAHRRPVPGHFARQSRSLRDFSQASISLFSGVGFGALGSRPGSEKQNFPVASHFPGCHRRGQRKDEEKIWQKKI